MCCESLAGKATQRSNSPLSSRRKNALQIKYASFPTPKKASILWLLYSQMRACAGIVEDTDQCH